MHAVAPAMIERARQLRLAGATRLKPSEVAAVHAALYPDAEAVCETCISKLGAAFNSIGKWLRRYDSSVFSSSSSPSISPSSPMAQDKKPASQYRFKSDRKSYREFGSPKAYTNANLTDKVAQRILANDPEAFDLLERIDGNPLTEQDAKDSVDEELLHESDEKAKEEDKEIVNILKLKKPELQAIYKELVGSDPDDKMTIPQLIEAIEATQEQRS